MANKNVTVTVTNWGTTLTPATNISITTNVGIPTPNSATLSSLTGGTVVTIDETATNISLTPTGECSGTTQTFSISNNPSSGGTVTNYYRMGNCNEVQYAYTATTNTGYGIIITPGCASASDLETMIWSDPAHTTYTVDYNDPCAFSTFTGTTYVAKITGSTIGATAVYNVYGVGCISMISGETQSTYNSTPSGFTVNLNNILTSYIGAGIGACGISPCNGSSFPTPSPQVVYDAEVCGSGDRVLIAEINPFDVFSGPLNPNEVYGVNLYDVSGSPLTGYCATIVSAYTENVEFYTATGDTMGNNLYNNPIVGLNIMTTGVTCGTCDANYYLVRGTRTGGCGEGFYETQYAWTTSGISVGDVFTVTGLTCTDHFCCYQASYVSPGKVNKYGFFGEGISGDVNVFRIYDDCPTCTGDTFQNVTAVTGSTASPNEYDDGEVSASITLDSNVDVNTSIVVEISTSGGGSPYNITISIPLGSSSGSNTYNTGATDPGAPNSACVVSSDNPLVDFGVFGCSP